MSASIPPRAPLAPLSISLTKLQGAHSARTISPTVRFVPVSTIAHPVSIIISPIMVNASSASPLSLTVSRVQGSTKWQFVGTAPPATTSPIQARNASVVHLLCPTVQPAQTNLYVLPATLVFSSIQLPASLVWVTVQPAKIQVHAPNVSMGTISQILALVPLAYKTANFAQIHWTVCYVILAIMSMAHRSVQVAQLSIIIV